MKKNKIDEYKQDAEKLLSDGRDEKNEDVKMYSDNFIQINPDKKDPRNNKSFFNYIRDGWLNLFTGIGTSRDKTTYTSFSGYTYLDDVTLTSLWVGDGFAKKISKSMADDMTREWITVENDTEKVIENKLKKLHAPKTFNLALTWMRHFGGGVIVMGVNDGKNIYEEINYSNIKSVDWIRVYDRTEISLTSINFTADPNDEHYAKPEFYTITPKYGAPFNAHWTRVLEFKGLPVPKRIESGQFWYWGMSVIQPIWEQIKDLGASERNISKLLYEFVVGKYKIKGLAQLMSQNDWEQIKKMIDVIDLGKSTIQSLIMDADGEDFIRDSVNVSGLPELIDRFMMFLAGVSNYPVTRLFGRSAAGMNATGEGDEKIYFSDVKAAQRNDLEEPIQILIDLINMSKEIPANKKVQDPMVIFNPLFQETQKEILENRKVQSEIDNSYINNGILSNEEVRESRFANGYSYETELIEGSFNEEDDIVEVSEEEE